MDKASWSAHIIGAKTGGAVAMQFTADDPKRTRSLVVVGGPGRRSPSPTPRQFPQMDRLGSSTSEEWTYWNMLFKTANPDGTEGLRKALSNFNLAKESVLQRITSPTLVITATGPRCTR